MFGGEDAGMDIKPRTSPLAIGEAAPFISLRTNVEPRAEFGNLAGRHVLVCAFGSAAAPAAGTALAALETQAGLHDWGERVMLAVTSSPGDAGDARLERLRQRILVAEDPGAGALRAWGLLRETPEGRSMTPVWMLLDPMLRVLGLWPLQEAAAALGAFAALPKVEDHAAAPLFAPVLLVPRIFEPEFCRRLIDHHGTEGSFPSGVTRHIHGRTVVVPVPGMKRRRDCLVAEGGLMTAIRARLALRLLPEIKRAFQFEVTRIERYLIGCYDAAESGGFQAHRDDTVPGTAHRRFAVSINLNAEEHEGGELRFPEYGGRCYRPPTGGAVVFSCSLLHEARPVTAGRRYAFLPFLYDEAAAALRLAQDGQLGEGVARYAVAAGG
jgi:hypothetical protein